VPLGTEQPRLLVNGIGGASMAHNILHFFYRRFAAKEQHVAFRNQYIKPKLINLMVSKSNKNFAY